MNFASIMQLATDEKGVINMIEDLRKQSIFILIQELNIGHDQAVIVVNKIGDEFQNILEEKGLI